MKGSTCSWSKTETNFRRSSTKLSNLSWLELFLWILSVDFFCSAIKCPSKCRAGISLVSFVVFLQKACWATESVCETPVMKAVMCCVRQMGFNFSCWECELFDGCDLSVCVKIWASHMAVQTWLSFFFSKSYLSGQLTFNCFNYKWLVFACPQKNCFVLFNSIDFSMFAGIFWGVSGGALRLLCVCVPAWF